ncbi:MAG: hypothetical protein AMXMBFR7_48970 [Planctomycetota bacterium]
MAERFIQSLKEECVWLRRFESLEELRAAIGKWVGWYNAECPHQALKYLTPDEVYAGALRGTAAA